MISFYPGPSRIYPTVEGLMQEAYQSGILSLNHRSPQFEELCSQTIGRVKKYLHAPENYQVVFTSSATECWEILAQSLIVEKSIHLHNGAFGAKWEHYTKKLGKRVISLPFQLEELPDLPIGKAGEMICLTSNETSNGSRLPEAFIEEAHKSFPDRLIAVDATSSLGGLAHRIEHADIWFASVQKCFGLPSGMAVMALSPKAIERAFEINERNHYNSLPFILDNFSRNQTPYTPNILDIFLLNGVLQHLASIDSIEEMVVSRAKSWETFLADTDLDLLIREPTLRSPTVITLQGDSEIIASWLEASEKGGFILGKGYGEWKGSTLRIANYPALQDKEIASLKSFLSDHFISK